MTAIARALSRAFVTFRDAESLKQVAIVCGIGLLVSLLLMLIYGLDLSPGFSSPQRGPGRDHSKVRDRSSDHR